MPKLRIDNFEGELERQSDTTLNGNFATVADNVRLYAGELQAWRGSSLEFSPVTTSVMAIYKFVNTFLDTHVWLTWDADVDVARSSLADSDDFRIYWTGDGTPKKSNWTMASDDTLASEFPGVWLEMGVPAPTTAPTVANNGTGSALAADTRYYVYTFVSTFGDIEEESAPSPVSSSVSLAASESVDLSSLETSPAGDYNITAIRIYRTLPGDLTVGSYAFVKEISIGTTSTNDDVLDSALGEAIPSIGWAEPPDTMKGLTSMANGMMAGFVDNSVYFCEPYFHHAWPAEYIQSIPDEIVGLASYGNTLVVMTKGTPWLMVGVDPAQMSVERLTIPEPCVAKKSIASDAQGVLYASPNGIVAIGPSSRGVISNQIFRRKEWQTYAPTTMVGAVYDGKYFLTYVSSEKGNRTMVVSRDDRPALSFLDLTASAFYTDIEEGELYYVDSLLDDIYQIDADALNPFTYEWTSKRFFMGRGVSWSAVMVDVDEAQIAANANYAALVAQVAAANATLISGGDPLGGEVNGSVVNAYPVNGSILQEVPLPGALLSCSLFILGELDELLASLTITEYKPYRLPNFKTRACKVKITGTLNVRSVTLGTNVTGLYE